LELRPPCNLTVDTGDENCDKNATIKYHLDAETLNCLPFKYAGCGGNANRFRSSSECRMRCLPMDYLKCPANSPPTHRADGTSDCDEVTKKCPEGSSCQRGFVVGICCDNKNLEKYYANVKPDCGHKKVVKDKSIEFPVSFLPDKSTQKSVVSVGLSGKIYSTIL
ncbi:Kunitz/Bovine pancreatic trypsin inhibitor domain protein, partial [Cooperia oncophora]